MGRAGAVGGAHPELLALQQGRQLGAVGPLDVAQGQGLACRRARHRQAGRGRRKENGELGEKAAGWQSSMETKHARVEAWGHKEKGVHVQGGAAGWGCLPWHVYACCAAVNIPPVACLPRASTPRGASPLSTRESRPRTSPNLSHPTEPRLEQSRLMACPRTRHNVVLEHVDQQGGVSSHSSSSGVGQSGKGLIRGGKEGGGEVAGCMDRWTGVCGRVRVGMRRPAGGPQGRRMPSDADRMLSPAAGKTVEEGMGARTGSLPAG